MAVANEGVVLVRRPTGVAQSEDFEVRALPLVEPEAGQIVVKNAFLSVEPAMRGWIADVGNYSSPVALESVMRSLAVGHVVASRHPDFSEGDVLTGWFGWQRFATVGADAVVRRVTETDLPWSLSLGVLGINGVTAYLALTQIGRPVAGETVVVSTAAGSVGSAAGQIAHLLGCRTVGITGGPEKVRQCVDMFGYDAALDYQAEGLDGGLAQACPDGIDVYYDNTSGEISDTVWRHLAIRARVIICGTAAYSTWTPWPSGPRMERHLLVKRARVEGFVIFDHMSEYEPAVAVLADWVRQDRLRYVEDILDGLEACPDAIAGLYRGENRGKRLIRL
ncbi:NADP-dependent oxidoreductase [soil metagenome]